ncbi:MAG: ribonuclease HIII [Candidatus Rhabdochlamydia sp.]
MTIFVTKIDTSLSLKLEQDLENQGFTLSKPPYTFFSATKPGISCTLYQSGKLTVQGKNKDDFILYYLEPEILKTTEFSHPPQTVDFTARIGGDEAGKGDFFGPLCIAAVYGDAKIIEELLKLGVKDSKEMTDPHMISLAPKIQAVAPSKVIKIFPSKYNEMYASFQNLNHLLAWGHAAAVSELSLQTGCKEVLIDQFAKAPLVDIALKKKGLRLNVTQRTKAESDPLVAAASILARSAFVQGMDRLSDEAGFTLPKGAASIVIKAGKRILEQKGKEALAQFCKLHFKTTQEVLH